jgi:pimeloyl-ACP methyl ester carboxylesterase
LDIRFTLAMTALLMMLVMPGALHAGNVHHNPPNSAWMGRKTLTWLDATNEVRYVEVYVPKSYAAKNVEIPLVMWFMGSRRNVRPDYHYIGISYEDSGLEPYAEKNGFLLVSIDQRHEGGKGWVLEDSNPLDESLILDVLDYLRRTFSIDETRIYLWGISAGGKLSQYMATKHSDVFTAVVSFSGVIDDFDDPWFGPYIKRIQESPRKFPIAHWQTEGDFEGLIKNMPRVIQLYKDSGYPIVDFVFLKNRPDRELRHEWYADLYNQRMWDWCKQFRLVNGETLMMGQPVGKKAKTE